VYIQAGEIVKGGKQDRTLGTDMIITRAMGKTPIASFCVEQGRWTRRGGEEAHLFGGGSSGMVAGREMKLAANSNYSGADQSKVWKAVAENQDALTRQLGESVNAPASPSSFQLTMEAPALKARTDDYSKKLAKTIDEPGNADAIGWAYAVNGQLSGANIYANAQLFRKLWPKLLESGVIEAVAERGEVNAGQPTTQPAQQAVVDFLSVPRDAKPAQQQVNNRTSCTTFDASDSVLLETTDAESHATVHRSYLKK
jgi:hypothetical protein